jgi:hypothetical protein
VWFEATRRYKGLHASEPNSSSTHAVAVRIDGKEPMQDGVTVDPVDSTLALVRPCTATTTCVPRRAGKRPGDVSSEADCSGALDNGHINFSRVRPTVGILSWSLSMSPG